jgi:hypothetical protein
MTLEYVSTLDKIKEQHMINRSSITGEKIPKFKEHTVNEDDIKQIKAALTIIMDQLQSLNDFVRNPYRTFRSRYKEEVVNETVSNIKLNKELNGSK